MNISLAKRIFFIFVIVLTSSVISANSKSATYISIDNKAYPRQNSNSKTVVVYLVGLAGTGKYTIAKKLANHGFKVVDNHLINNPIFSLLGHNGAKRATDTATEKISRIRNIVFEFIVEDNKSNYVLTNQLLENNYHNNIYNKVKTTAALRGSVFIPVDLIISSEERARRIVTPERAKQFKITDKNEAYKPQKSLNISDENMLHLNVTNLSVDQAAEKIVSHIKRILNTQ